MRTRNLDGACPNERKKRILAHGLRRAIGRAEAHHLADQVRDDKGKHYANADAAQRRVNLVIALLEGGRITEDEFVVFAAHPVENVHEGPDIEKRYPELKSLSKAMSDIERSEGLKEDEYWRLSDAPIEYQTLNERYVECLAVRFGEELDKFGLHGLATLWRNDPDRFKEMRERGRRSVFEADDSVAAILQAIQTYEDEAARCSDAGAYYASCVMLGSSTEARLLLMCLTRQSEVSAVLDKLQRKDAPKNRNPLHWNLEHLIRIADECGWLKSIEDEQVRINVSSYLVRLQQTRNLLHAGRHAREMPHISIGAEAHKDAQIAYESLMCCLDEFGTLKDMLAEAGENRKSRALNE